MSIAENINTIKQTIPNNVELVAVSKFHGLNAIRESYDCGLRVFGESRMPELKQKVLSLPSDIEWHFIGHLQSNKVKDAVQYSNTIQSVDSPKLLWEIEKQATKLSKPIKCLLEIHIAEEESKTGFSFSSCKEFIAQHEWKNNKFVYIAGLMGMATNTDNCEVVRKEFQQLKLLFDTLKKNYFIEDERFCEISMGMSHDYTIAIEEGSTMVRIGTSIFGNREY